MYDSRSNHERNCTRQKDREQVKAHGYDKDGVRLKTRILPERAAIAEQIPVAFAAPTTPGLKTMRGHYYWATYVCSHGHTGALADASRCGHWHYRDFRPRLEWALEAADQDEATDERMARWEVELLTLRGFDAESVPASTVWTETSALHVDVWDEPEPEQEPLPDEDLGIEHDTVWLDSMTPVEFFDAVGDAWVPEGPSDSRTPEVLRRDHAYVKVSDLAFEVGIESKHLIAFMREEGEYVRNASSWVAEPIAAIARNYREGLIAKYGPRKQATTPARTFAQLVADGGRQGAPQRLRPGRCAVNEERALQAAQRRRQRIVADIKPDEPAKVPTPMVEHPEPSPYKKFGGVS